MAPPGDHTTTVPVIVHPTAADDIVIRIEGSGGSTSVESSFSQPPGFVLTGEGTAYVAAWDDRSSGRLADFAHFVSAWAREIRSPPAQRYQPDALSVFALPLPFVPGQGIDVGSWPSDSSVRLSTIGRCSVVRDRAVIRLLEGSTADHYRDDGTTYVVAAADLLPGDSCSSTHS